MKCFLKHLRCICRVVHFKRSSRIYYKIHIFFAASFLPLLSTYLYFDSTFCPLVCPSQSFFYVYAMSQCPTIPKVTSVYILSPSNISRLPARFYSTFYSRSFTTKFYPQVSFICQAFFDSSPRF